STPPTSRSAEVATRTFSQSAIGSTSIPSPPQTGAVPVAQPTSSAEYVISEIKRHKVGALAVSAIALLVVVVVGVGLYKFVTSKTQTITKPSGAGVSS